MQQHLVEWVIMFSCLETNNYWNVAVLRVYRCLKLFLTSAWNQTTLCWNISTQLFQKAFWNLILTKNTELEKCIYRFHVHHYFLCQLTTLLNNNTESAILQKLDCSNISSHKIVVYVWLNFYFIPIEWSLTSETCEEL